MTLTGTTIAGQCGPGSNGNEGVLHIPQSSKTGASPSDSLMPYLGHSPTGSTQTEMDENWHIWMSTSN